MYASAEWKVKIPTAAIISKQYYSGTSEAQNNLSTVVCVVRRGSCRRHSFTHVQGDHCHGAAGPSDQRMCVCVWVCLGGSVHDSSVHH